MYRSNYLYTHDIDWFCLINRIPVHIASNGGNLPRRSYTIRQLVSLQNKVANMEQQFKFSINTSSINTYLKEGEYYPNLNELSEQQFREMLPNHFDISQDYYQLKLSREILLYGWSFIEMAKRGFYSFDRIEGDLDNSLYRLIAWPTNYDVNRFDRVVFHSLQNYNAPSFLSIMENSQPEGDVIMNFRHCFLQNTADITIDCNNSLRLRNK